MEPVQGSGGASAGDDGGHGPSAFAAGLRRLLDRQDRAALAALRRGLGKAPGEVSAMHPLVVPFLPDQATRKDDEAYYLIGSLFGLHPLAWGGEGRAPSMGAHLASLRARDEKRAPGIDRRMIAMLNAHRDDLGVHLRQIMSVLRTAAVPIAWAQLLRDVVVWDHPDRRVQRNWARAYYRNEQATTVGISDVPTDREE